jgi:hypothetical protein
MDGNPHSLARLVLHNNLLGMLSGVLAIALLQAGRTASRTQKVVTAAVWLFVACRGVLFLSSNTAWDLRVFHALGQRFWSGTDVYADIMAQSPPTAVPLYALFALATLPVASAAWFAFNLAALFGILALAKRIFATLQPGITPTVWYSEAGVTVAVVLSVASTWGLDAGQMTVWTTLWIYLGLLALAQDRDVAAGLCFAPATVKAATVLPFLIPSLAWRRWRTWIGLGAGVLALPMAWPSDLMAMVMRELRNIAAARQPGLVNDYSFAGPFHDDMLGLEHWLYCLGFRDPALIAGLQLTLLAGVTLWIAWRFSLRREPADKTQLFALLCTLSCLYLYHRQYDTIILALPLLYCASGARRSEGARRAGYLAAAAGLILVMDFPRGWRMLQLAEWSVGAGVAGRLVQIFVLPYPAWLLMFASAALIALGPERADDTTGRAASIQAP